MNVAAQIDTVVGPGAAGGTLRVQLRQTGSVPLDVDFSCDQGDVVALLGPSGSGKTTTLKAIAGLLTPTEGLIELGDHVWFNARRGVCVRPESRRVGFVFQDYALFPHLNVLQNVTLAMGHVPRALRIERGLAILERIGLGYLRARKPHALSGGERQRLGIARALARDPQVLLLDEPFSAIDRPAREKLKIEVRALAQTAGVPVVLVTHDIDEAIAMAARLVIIDQGRTIATGTPAAIIKNPGTQRVADIIGIDFPAV